ncbi:MAG: hypothetical protein AAGF24_04805 [Cyanobacteria bacterium P01_H01_bin.121]
MAIRIKRSSGNAAPSSLAAGQMAYAEGTGGTAEGGALFIGEIGGNVAEIGGRKYVDKVTNLENNRDLTNLSDVDAASPSNGQVLTWNNSTGQWEAQAPGSGVTTFIALNDSPANYTGAALSWVRVNAAGNGLEFVQDLDDGTF